MKQVFTISIDEELVQKIRDRAREGSFRNKSHLVEQAIKRFLEGKWGS
ncbi:ribbon-helix-helix protein, CopG family [Candidatus Woesearchaeota archaeon]|nr:ribbon-helix-helix protein, CopG family [Candidatus Woesearchaeota archaeon]